MKKITGLSCPEPKTKHTKDFLNVINPNKSFTFFLQIIAVIFIMLIPCYSDEVQDEAYASIISESQSRYGICGHLAGNGIRKKLEDGNIEWVRIDFNWPTVQPTGPSQFNWTTMDEVIDGFSARGISIFATIGYTPAWANGGHSDDAYPPVDVNQWKAFVEASVKRYKNQITYWGIWNEPDLDHFFKGTLEDYVYKVLVPAAEAIRYVERITKKNFYVCAPEVSKSAYFVYKTLQLAGDKVDVVTGHYYGTIDEIMNKVNQYIGYSGSRPVWLTEVGWKSGDVGEWGQADRIYRLLQRIEDTPALDKVFIFHSHDASPNGHGLMYVDDGIHVKLSYLLYRWFIGTNGAVVTSTTYPAVVTSNQIFQLQVTVQNTGDLVWTHDYRYALDCVGTNYWPILDSSDLYFSETDRVEPGESHTFDVTAVAPEAPGNYSLGWRMEAIVEGTGVPYQPFGDLVYTAYTVIAPEPAITQHPGAQLVSVGQTATFSVAATGAAPMNYRWQKDGADIYNGGDISGAASKNLTIKNCQTATSGSYRCKVWNPHGTVYSNNAVLTVSEPQEPYLGAPASIPGIIQAENYDLGGEGSAYHDTTAGNICNPPRYRFEDVDIQLVSDTGGGYNVGYIATGEWLEYTVNVTQTGYYDFDVRVAAPQNSSFRIEMGGANVTGSRGFRSTGGGQNWTTVKIPRIYLGAGQKIMRFYAESSNFNLNYISIITGNQAPYQGTVRAIPGTLQAEDYDTGGQNAAYYDTTPGNICYYKNYRFDDVDVENAPSSGSTINVGYIATNEWLEYTVNVSQSGYYRLDVRTAAPTGGAFRIEGDGAYLTGTLSIPSSGQGAQNYAVHSYSNIYLPKGKMILKVKMLNALWNLDYFKFVKL